MQLITHVSYLQLFQYIFAVKTVCIRYSICHILSTNTQAE